ncbi:MAG TPA: dihydroorotase [Elusimicrobiota bacterium]|nr:dihydroorotase [Elusimicrobiota bacterium]
MKEKSSDNKVPRADVLLIRGGRVVDPAHKRDGVMDVLMENGKIARVGKNLAVSPAVETVDARGLVVIPGLVDMHVHLREPGNEDAETIESGTRSAAAGGITGVAAMPNTNPPPDNVSGIRFLLRKAAEEGAVRVWPVGTITHNRAGKALSEIGAMSQAGCVALSDDGSAVADSQVLRRAMEYARLFHLTVIEHAEDKALFSDGVMNDGPLATRLGYRGIPRQAEYVVVARDIALAELTGARLHLAHLSTRESVDLVRQAKRRGLAVTAEVTPHHFTLTEEAVVRYGTNAKINPPLRTKDDREALWEGLADGTIDAIASDHAPHIRSAKEQEFAAAPFGIVGLETLLPLTVTQLIDKKILSWPEAVRKMCWNPARILNVPAGHLGAGAPADVTLVDPRKSRKVMSFSSRSDNSPFLGWALRGFARMVFVGGRRVFGTVA